MFEYHSSVITTPALPRHSSQTHHTRVCKQSASSRKILPFQNLSSLPRKASAGGPRLCVVLFDMLFADGQSMLSWPLRRRKAALEYVPTLFAATNTLYMLYSFSASLYKGKLLASASARWSLPRQARCWCRQPPRPRLQTMCTSTCWRRWRAAVKGEA